MVLISPPTMKNTKTTSIPKAANAASMTTKSS